MLASTVLSDLIFVLSLTRRTVLRELCNIQSINCVQIIVITSIVSSKFLSS